MKFLEAVAERYADCGPLDRICFVFPNRRSGTFFKRYLGRAAKKPVFVPNVLTIDELFARVAHTRETRQKARLLYILYQEYIKLMPGSPETGPEPFDQFIYWGDILLSDFDDIDKYLIVADHLLVNLRDLKAINAGNDFLEEDQKAAIASFCKNVSGPGEGQARFAEIWNILSPLYHSFREALQQQGLAYPGMIYRSVAESLSKDDSPTGSPILEAFDKIVFIGLNALNGCEKKLLSHLQGEKRAEFYWDYAGMMTAEDKNPAGLFLRHNIQDYPPPASFHCPAETPKKNLEVIRVPSAVGQTRKALQILESLQDGDGVFKNPEETAVVLPDENLLFPMLGAVPKGVDHVNVTMGYSLSASNGATLFQCLNRLQSNLRDRNGTTAFYHRDVTEILEHPYFVAMADAGVIADLDRRIRDENRIYVPVEDLAAAGEPFSTVFRVITRTQNIPDYLLAVIEALQAGQEELEREFLSYLHQAVAELASAGLPLETLLPKTWYRLLQQYIALIKIPFEGEPLRGLQVMGPLETRALDFQNVIILSVGEGSFPSRSVSASFIPYSLRLAFGLPTYEQQDAMWAYYFYRIICRAERIWLLFDSRTENGQTGEESRFIKQLRYLQNVSMTEKVATYSLGVSPLDDAMRHIRKDERVMQLLEERFIQQKKPFSASALNTFIECPLNFYYKYVEGIQEQEEVVEDLGADLFGTIFHTVMERLYKPFRKCHVTPQDLDEATLFGPHTSRLETMVTDIFAENNIREIAGQNLILRDLIVHFVRRVVAVDRELAQDGQFWIHDVEQPVYHSVILPQSKRRVYLKGIIDRLDSVKDGVVRIVDYKSGKVDDKPGIKFQLNFYSLLMNRAHPRNDIIYEPCIYSLRSIFKTVPEPSPVTQPELDSFEEEMLSIIERIFDPNLLFEPGPELDGDNEQSPCDYCNFKVLCNKE